MTTTPPVTPEFSFFQRTNGRWVLAIKVGETWKGARQIQAPAEVKGGTTARPSPAAKRWRDRIIGEIQAAGGRPPVRGSGSPTLRECHARLMTVREGLPNVKASSIANNWSHLRAQILTRPIADIPMAAVGVPEARAIVRAVRESVSPNHTRNVYSTLRMLWDAAEAEGLIKVSNPFANRHVQAEVPAARALHGGINPITIPLPAVQAILSAPDETIALERRVRLALAVAGGFDDGEIAGLTWAHVHDERPAAIPEGEWTPYVEIRQALAIRGKDGYATVDTPKTVNRLRDVPLHPAAVAGLLEWRAGFERLLRRKPKPKDFVFPTAEGKGLRPPSPQLLRDDLRVVNALAVGAGRAAYLADDALKLITFKATRRTFSSTLKSKGVDEEDRGRLMGHSGRSVTARNYTAHELARLAELIARIPLQWGSIEIPVVTDSGPATGCANSAPETVTMPEGSTEARTGFEPVYDGFAIRQTVWRDEPGSDVQAEISMGNPTTSVGTARTDGTGSASPCDTSQGESVATGHLPGIARARAASGAEGARVEVDGRVVARTDVAPGEPLEAVEARLRHAAGEGRGR